MPKLSEVRKFLVSAVGVTLSALAVASQYAELMPAEWANGIGIAIAVLTPIATYLIPNAPPQP